MLIRFGEELVFRPNSFPTEYPRDCLLFGLVPTDLGQAVCTFFNAPICSKCNVTRSFNHRSKKPVFVTF